MHDIRMIRDNPAAFDAALSRRGLDAMSSEILAIDSARRAKIAAAEEAQAAANKAAKEVGAAKGRGDEDEFQRLRTLMADKKAEIATLNEEAKAEDVRLTALLAEIPNLPYDDVPNGASTPPANTLKFRPVSRASTSQPLAKPPAAALSSNAARSPASTAPWHNS